MEQFSINERNQVKRSPKRGHYDKATIYKILDDTSICHVAFVIDNKPYLIPTIFGRDKNTLYLHGAAANRMLGAIEKGVDVAISVTHVDGLVLARSAMHHSMNYRSVIIYGKGKPVEDPEEKEKALYCVSEQVLKGRWDEARKPNAKELKTTKVIKVEIEDASAKMRTGGPNDDEEDYALDIWAGVLPIHQVYGNPVKDELMKQDLDLPKSLQDIKP